MWKDMATGLYRALMDQDWRRQAIQPGSARAQELSWDANARKTAVVYQEVYERCCRKNTAANT